MKHNIAVLTHLIFYGIGGLIACYFLLYLANTLISIPILKRILSPALAGLAITVAVYPFTTIPKKKV